MMTDDLHEQSGASPAVPVASAVASISSMSPPHRWRAGRSLRRILAVAACELRLQRRSPACWIAAAIVALVTVGLALLQSPAPGKMTNSATTAVTVCEGAALFASLLLPWVASGAFARDAKRRFSPLLWTRPVAPGEYALGKVLAVSTLSLLLGLPSILIGWVAVGIVRGSLQPADLWLGMLPVVATTMCMAAVVALLCVCIAPTPHWARSAALPSCSTLVL